MCLPETLMRVRDQAMSTLDKTADLTRQDEEDLALVSDRRRNDRQIATFRTSCLLLDGEAHPAILRNMSDGGAMFEVLVPVTPEALVTYWWDGIQPVEARVAWVKGNRIGVANLDGAPRVVDVPRPRATRVPIHLPVRIWTGSGGQWTKLHNISMSGVAVTGLKGVAPGTLCTIELNGETLHNACIARVDDGIAGIRFERPLAPARLMQLIESGGHADVTEPPAAPRPDEQRASISVEATEKRAEPAPTQVRRFI